MKKILLIIFSMISNCIYGQIELEHTFNEPVIFYNGVDVLSYNNDVLYKNFWGSSVVRNDSIKIKCYNYDYKVTWETNLKFETPENCQVTDANLFSSGIINSGDIEFFVCLYNKQTQVYKLCIYNSKGENIYEIKEYNTTPIIMFGILSINDTAKFMIRYGDKTDIFVIKNYPITDICKTSTVNFTKAYPTPAHNFINIDLPGNSVSDKISIYDLNGNLKASYQIKNKNQITFDVSDYLSGLYIYKVGNYLGKFIVR